MSPLFYVCIGMLIAFTIAAIIQRDINFSNGSNFVYNKETNQIGIILFEAENHINTSYYRVHTHGIWSKQNCIRLNRKQCNKLLAMSNSSWLHPTKPDLKTLNLI